VVRRVTQMLEDAEPGVALNALLAIAPATAEIYENQLREVGIRLKIQTVEWAAYVKDVYGENNFQLGQSAVVREFDPDAMTSGVFGTKASGNPGLYSSPRMDELLRMGRAELNRDKRKAIYREISQLVVQDVPAIRQQTWPVLWGATSKVKGLSVNALGRPNLLEIELG
jgi:peptide/nickel transport system substrate-binding protein